MTRYVSILLPLPLSEPFTYAVPEGMVVAEGAYVEVPFGRKHLKGIVWADAETTLAAEKIKPIHTLLPLPPMPPPMRAFIQWVADYTLCPPGAVLKMALSVPGALEPSAPETETYYTPGTQGNVALTRQRKAVFDYLAQQGEASLETLCQGTGVGKSVIRLMAETGALHTIEKEKKAETLPLPVLPPLAGEQQQAAHFLNEKLEEKTYSAILLDGVTGSGKTEVYFAVIRHILEKPTGQALVLLPEIVLTSQWLTRFKERFGFTPALWHSGLTPKQRRETWQGIHNGSVRLVVGARSALFLPFSSLQFIVVDEEHDASFKQEEGVTYHARDMAVVRAYLENIPVVLASATPSLETLQNVALGKFSHLTLPSRFGNAVLPKVELVDMRLSDMQKNTWISPRLRQEMAETLTRGKQVMLYLNRRGYAPLTLCRACGHKLQCPHCASWLVEHRALKKLQCHHCGYQARKPEQCPTCKETDTFIGCGPGVERIAEEVASFLPQARLALMTSDSIATPAQAKALVEQITAQEVDVIIGTQMMAKGHHFPHLALVGVVDADLGMAGGDPRTAERTYQLLLQVAGRAGREGEQGKVILQSCIPENRVLHALVSGQRDQFLQDEQEGRKRAQMPPFSRLAALVISGKQEAQVAEIAKTFAKKAPQDANLMVLGPIPAPLSYLRGKYRYRLLFRAKKTFPLQKALKFLLNSVKTPSAVHVKVDIDPYHFL